MVDILLGVFELLLFDATTLSRAMRVNSLWAETASRFLWMTVQEERLLNIKDRQRQQYYMDSIRILIARLEPAAPARVIEGVEFRRLRTLSVRSLLPTSCVQRYLVSTLTDLYWSGHLPVELGEQLSERCPQLRHSMFSITAPFGDHDAACAELATLLAFLQRCTRPLLAVTLPCIWLDCAEGRAVFEHLAHRAKLAELCCGAIDSYGDIFAGTVPAAAAPPPPLPATSSSSRSSSSHSSEQRPLLPRERSAKKAVAAAVAALAVVRFGDLRALSMRMSARQTEGLSRSSAAVGLTSLRVHVTDRDCARLFTALAPLRALTALWLRFVGADGSVRLTDDSLCALRPLRRLCSVTLAGATLAPAPALTDAGFSATVRWLPHLQSLQLAFAQGALRLAGAALAAVGESCRKLERLEVCGPWDLSCWRDARTAPLFPRLLFLRLDKAIMKQEGTACDRYVLQTMHPLDIFRKASEGQRERSCISD
jgi:hypothetical protein